MQVAPLYNTVAFILLLMWLIEVKDSEWAKFGKNWCKTFLNAAWKRCEVCVVKEKCVSLNLINHETFAGMAFNMRKLSSIRLKPAGSSEACLLFFSYPLGLWLENPVLSHEIDVWGVKSGSWCQCASWERRSSSQATHQRNVKDKKKEKRSENRTSIFQEATNKSLNKCEHFSVSFAFTVCQPLIELYFGLQVNDSAEE